MPNLGPLAALFNLRPDRAADYLLAKGFQLSGPYWELDGPAHSHVFTVANLAKLDVLADIKSAVQQAIDKGQTEKWFETQLVDVLKRKGWWGPGVRVDPDTLEAKIIQQGSLRRLQTIYRTNLQTAYMAGRHRQALEQIDRRPWAQYLAIRDHRTRPAHAALHGQVFRLDSPAWAVIAPTNSYNCFPGNTLVRAAARLALKTWYAGPMVELQTSLGHHLTVTVNHPILARRGWVCAGDLQEGDQLLGTVGVVNPRLPGIVDHEEPPTRADDLFQSLAREGLSVSPMAADDFHGDARFRKGEIHIAGADRGLVDKTEPGLNQRVREGRLGRGYVRLGVDADAADGATHRDFGVSDPRFMQDAPDVRDASPCLPGDRPRGSGAGTVKGQYAPLQMRVLPVTSDPCRAELTLHGATISEDDLPLFPLRRRTATQRYPSRPEFAVEDLAGTANPFRKLLEANAGFVSADKVVKIRKFDFVGHVYDCETETGLILAGGLVVHNCRCRARYLSDRDLEKKGLKPAADVRILEREPPGKRPVDPLTGETPARWLQRGVSVPDPLHPGERLTLWADPGWDHLPGSDGAERALVDRLMAKAETLGDGIKMAAVDVLREQNLRPARLAAYADWVDGVMAQPGARGREWVIGYLALVDEAALIERGGSVANGSIVLSDRLLVGPKAGRHDAAGNALSAEEWKQVPRLLAAPEAVLYDRVNGTLLYVLPSQDGRKTKIVIEGGRIERKREAYESVRAAFKVQVGDLLGQQFELLRGSL